MQTRTLYGTMNGRITSFEEGVSVDPEIACGIDGNWETTGTIMGQLYTIQ